MQINYANLDTCHTARGAVVVIDVLRAFTTAAYAFAAGAERIVLVDRVERAFELRCKYPDWLLMGEVDGKHIPGFNFGNSPAAIASQDLHGRTLVQRTSSGTQGVARCQETELLLCASFVVAGATLDYLRNHRPRQVTLLITGEHSQDQGDEDRACADYLAALLRGENPAAEAYLSRVRNSAAGREFGNPDLAHYPAADLDLAVNLDQFPFAMRASWQQELRILHMVPPKES